MSDPHPTETLTTDNPEWRLRCFESTWQTWHRGDPIPSWQAYLPPIEEPCSREQIFRLLQTDIEGRIKAGLTALLSERYFEHPRLQYPDARLDSAQRIELIRWEYQQRWQKGERARREEYQSAFPQFTDALSELKPTCSCPSCRRTIALNETENTLHCPHCDSESPLGTVSPLLVAALVMPIEEAPGLDLRDYQLIESLGQGGMGEVYRAADPALGRDLAIKVMKAQYRDAPHAESRFLREARITGSLQHPGIVPIYNLGRLADGRLHYTMRLVRGRTLADILRQEAGQMQRLPALVAIFEKVCQAVAYAHSKRVIHRDLKPANVMVGSFGEVQVMDWGLAKLLAEGERGGVSAPCSASHGALTPPRSPQDADTPLDLTQVGSGMGTPAYMPPEQALGEWDSVDERADVFALGAILCEILTGQPPYRGPQVYAILEQAKRGDVAEAMARLERSDADAALVTLCRECLAPLREARPRDAGALAQRVADYQTEVQARLRRVEVERAEAVVQAREEHRRRRWTRAFLVLFFSAAMLSTWLMMRARDAEKIAVTERDNTNTALVRAEEAGAAERQAKEAEFEQRQRAEEQRRQAQANAQQAEDSEKDTMAVLEFFQNKVLRAGRPQGQAGGLGKDLTLRQAVDAAEHDIAGAFEDRPLVEAAIRTTLGATYRHLAEWKLALEQSERALRLYESTLGSDHHRTLDARNNLATVYRAAGRTADAISLFEQTLKRMEATLGADHPSTLTCRNNLAGAYREARRIGQALRLFEQNLPLMEAKHGADDPQTIAGRNNLAVTYLAVGRTADAIRLFERNLKPMESKLGTDHPDTLGLRNNLAHAYLTAGRVAEALPLCERTLQQLKAKLGADHPTTILPRDNLAKAYRAVGRTDEAIALRQKNLQLGEAKLGGNHPNTLLTMANLASLYRDTGRMKEAVALLETALERGRKRRGGLPALVAGLPGALAMTYERAGRLDKAEGVYREIVSQTEKQYGADDPRTASAMAQLGANLVQQKKYSDAEAVLRKCLTIRENKQPDAWNTFNTRSALGEALVGLKKYAEAEPLLRQGYEGLKQQQDKIPQPVRQLRLREALARLVQLYDVWGKKDKADEWRKKL